MKSSWAIEALKSEFPDTHKDFASTDADAMIPEDTAAVLVDLIEQNGVFERNALSYPMPSDRTAYPKKTGRTAAVPMGQGVAQGLANIATGAATTALAGLAAGFVGVEGLLSLYDPWIERIEAASERL